VAEGEYSYAREKHFRLFLSADLTACDNDDELENTKQGER
jgi:hypothetical protein